MILVDCETTGLIKPGAVPLNLQPHIIELAALMLDDGSLEEVDHIHFLVRPPVLLEEVITKITGLKDEDLTGQMPFAGRFLEVREFFWGQRTLVAHNLAFDSGMLRLELERMGRLIQFPWPPLHRCTVELTMGFKGHRLKQEELYLMAMGRPAEQTHRALDDVRQLADVVRWLRKEHKLI